MSSNGYTADDIALIKKYECYKDHYVTVSLFDQCIASFTLEEIVKLCELINRN